MVQSNKACINKKMFHKDIEISFKESKFLSFFLKGHAEGDKYSSIKKSYPSN